MEGFPSKQKTVSEAANLLINPGAGRDIVSESGPFFFGNDPSQVGTNTTFEAIEEEVREELTAPFDDLIKP